MTIVRLEQENDVLATELVQSKVQLRTEMDEVSPSARRRLRETGAVCFATPSGSIAPFWWRTLFEICVAMAVVVGHCPRVVMLDA